jgi:serine protease
MKKTCTFPLLLTLFLAYWGQTSTAQTSSYVPGELLVQTVPGYELQGMIERLQTYNGQPTGLQSLGLISPPMRIWHLKFDHNAIQNEEDFLHHVWRQPEILVAQFNHHIEERGTVPNDPQFNQQWQWVNTGFGGGTADADVDADLAWDITTGGMTANGDEIVVCVVEGGGSNFNHPDLLPNAWINMEEIPGNGIDDDGNGYVDDIYGWNASQNNGNIPAGNHGTGVSGMIGATGNNGLGVTGINWNVKIMQVSMGGLTESNVIAAYTYPLVMRKRYNETQGQEGAFVVSVNSSWGINQGNPNNYPLWCAFYDTLGVHGIISCGATANSNWDVDVVGDMPTACPSEYQISVTATNHNDLRTFSAYGFNTIHVAAPGGNIYTTNGTSGYTSTSGTSFASPLTAGLVALLYSAPCSDLADLAITQPAVAATIVRQAILEGVDSIPSLVGVISTGGRVNAYTSLIKILESCGACLLPSNLAAAEILDTAVVLQWTQPPASVGDMIRFREVGAVEWDTLTSVLPPYTLQGLLGCRNYEMQVKTLCEEEASEFGESLYFSSEGCCTAPESPELVSFDENNATFNWEAVYAAESYTVRYRIAGEADWIETQQTETSFSLNNLLACTAYELQIETNCGPDSTSGYTDILSFASDCPCDAPEFQDVIEIDVYSATIQWAACDNASSYTLRYRKSNEVNWTFLDIEGATEIQLTELDSCFNYAFQIRTNCPVANSSYTSSSLFKTECQPLINSTLDAAESTRMLVAPNPFSESIALNLHLRAAAQEARIRLYDVQGRQLRLVELGSLSAGSQQFTLNQLAPLPAGVYLLELELDGQRLTERIIK